jgi:S-formylglutathione hydrolase FrmB
MKKFLFVIALIVMALTLIQCSKRSNPVDVELEHGRVWIFHFNSTSIMGDYIDDYWTRYVTVYTPPGYDSTSTGQPYPVLYLLHGYGGDEQYFHGLYGVANLLDELIASGKIEPMIVVTPDATNNLGGSFYTNSPIIGTGQSYAGLMQDFITNEVVPMVDSLFNTIPDRAHRGVAGHSMGGYGAIKLAMLRNDLFNSAASMSGPLAFWGSNPISPDFDGILELLPAVYQENGFNPLDTIITGDTAAFYHIGPGNGKRVTNMMFAMGAAFSPRDPANPDTTYAHYFSTGFVNGYIGLPFDVTGQVVDSIWNMWLANDVTALFAAGYGGVFDSTALYIDAGNADDLGLQYHAQVFAQVAGAAVDEFEIYPGIMNGTYPADHISLIHERLKKVFKFHSDAFGG